MDRLSYEIFSILESKFLFGYDDRRPEIARISSAAGMVRVLSIDAVDGAHAGGALVRLETSIRKLTGNPAARIADFFDLVAGSGFGGVLAALLFTRGPGGRPLFSASEALRFVANHRRRMAKGACRKGILGGVLCRPDGPLRSVFGDSTLRDALKPMLIPCYDLATGAPFVFSRADAVAAEGFDFRMEEVCAATTADPASGAGPVEMRSVDGRTRIRAVGGGLAMWNPAAAAITHVLNNRHDFPDAGCMDDLLMISLGGGGKEESMAAGKTAASLSTEELSRIAGNAQADLVDQAVAMAFGERRATNYFRIQGCGAAMGTATALEALKEKAVESVIFQGRKPSELTNGEKLHLFTTELIREENRRKQSVGGGGASSAMTRSVSSASRVTPSPPPPDRTSMIELNAAKQAFISSDGQQTNDNKSFSSCLRDQDGEYE